MRDDWRLANQKDYLYRATLKKTEFKASPTNDHEHCALLQETRRRRIK